MVWRKSSFSDGADSCVEVAPVRVGFAVRDSKQPTGPTLAFEKSRWRRFLELAVVEQPLGLAFAAR
jgi:hypothetical protein